MSEVIVLAPPARKVAKFRRAVGVCKECEASLRERREGALFCSQTCKDKFNNRLKVQGASVITIAKRWKRFRKGSDLTLLSRLLTNLVAEDIENGLTLEDYPDPPLEAFTIVSRTGYRRRA